MALASGFLAQGKRVAVMDCTDQAGSNADSPHPSTLQTWMKRMAACKMLAPQLELIDVQTLEEVEDAIAAARVRGVDVLLIDTSAQLYEPQLVALSLADLIIAPATGPFEAKCISDGVDKYLGMPEHLLGLITGCRYGTSEAVETRRAFGHHAVFQSELPWADALSDQIRHGSVAHFVSTLSCTPERAGFGRYRDALAAWVAVQQLTCEVDWALKGQRLESYNREHSTYSYKRKAVA